MKKILKFLAISLSAIVIVNCTTNDPNRKAKTGAAVGAVVGAVLGHQTNKGSGKYVGAVVGALAGGAIGHYMDNQQKEFEKELEEEKKRNELNIERLKDDTLKLSVNSEVSFDYDKYAIKPAFNATLDKLASVIIKYNRTVVHVIGHTDSRGSDAYNLDLSKRRAESVVSYLISRGVPIDRLRSEGRGEKEPRAENKTEAGRQLNRRVDLFIKPVEQGQEYKAYEPPSY